MLVRENDFDSIQDEINFFKIHKPYIYGRLKLILKKAKTLFPNISNQKLNLYLKEIADLCKSHKEKIK